RGDRPAAYVGGVVAARGVAVPAVGRADDARGVLLGRGVLLACGLPDPAPVGVVAVGVVAASVPDETAAAPDPGRGGGEPGWRVATQPVRTRVPARSTLAPHPLRVLTTHCPSRAARLDPLMGPHGTSPG
ncbi:MAG: hypothetical protein ACYCXA_10810, partial [Actinomycetes bacterium]